MNCLFAKTKNKQKEVGVGQFFLKALNNFRYSSADESLLYISFPRQLLESLFLPGVVDHGSNVLPHDAVILIFRQVWKLIKKIEKDFYHVCFLLNKIRLVLNSNKVKWNKNFKTYILHRTKIKFLKLDTWFLWFFKFFTTQTCIPWPLKWHWYFSLEAWLLEVA